MSTDRKNKCHAHQTMRSRPDIVKDIISRIFIFKEIILYNSISKTSSQCRFALMLFFQQFWLLRYGHNWMSSFNSKERIWYTGLDSIFLQARTNLCRRCPCVLYVYVSVCVYTNKSDTCKSIYYITDNDINKFVECQSYRLLCWCLWRYIPYTDLIHAIVYSESSI